MSRNWDWEGGRCGDRVFLLVAGKYLVVWSYLTPTFFWDNGLYYRVLGGQGSEATCVKPEYPQLPNSNVVFDTESLTTFMLWVILTEAVIHVSQ